MKGVTLAKLAALGGIGALLVTAGRVDADTDEGHLRWAALQQGLASGTPITACSAEFPTSTQTAVSRWNSALAHGSFQDYCSYAQLWPTTSYFFDPDYGCRELPGGGWPYACTLPTVFPPEDESIVNPTYVRMNPDLFGPGKQWQDGDYDTNRTVTHEFGHALGHDDYTYCPDGATVMDWTATCPYDTPQPLDVANYEAAYRPNAVTSLAGTSPASGRVDLSWDPGDVHAEAFFDVYRWGTDVGNVEKNGSEITLYNQPSGEQRYAVYGYTHALEAHWGDEAAVYVDVLPPIPSPPAAVTLSGSNGSGTVTWNAVGGATYYNVHVGRWNGGSYIDVVGDDDTASPYYFQYPISDWYHAGVQACNTAGCSDWTASDPWWVALAPGTPAINSVQTISANQLRVNWSWGTPPGDYVFVERKTGQGGTYASVGSPDNASPFDDGGLSPGTTYCYHLRSYEAGTGGYSDYSNERCGTTTSDNPGIPAISSVQTLGSTSLRVNWSWGNPPGSFVYIQRKIGTGGVYVDVGSDTASPLDNSNLSPGTTYCYHAKACYDAQNCSVYSGDGCGTTSGATGSIHLKVKAVDSNGYVLGDLAGATAKRTNTSGTVVYDTQYSDANGWVQFNNVPFGTYGILAYKAITVVLLLPRPLSRAPFLP